MIRKLFAIFLFLKYLDKQKYHFGSRLQCFHYFIFETLNIFLLRLNLETKGAFNPINAIRFITFSKNVAFYSRFFHIALFMVFL
jgi:hypothetical protein